MNIQNVIHAIQQNTAYSLLHIGNETSVFHFVENHVIQNEITLNTGVKKIAAQFFRNGIPGEAEVENAINHIEDELMAHLEIRDKNVKLYNADPLIAEILHTEKPATKTLAIQNIEDRFTQYALLSMGRSPVLSDISPDNEKYAGILILREILHHLNFDSVTILNLPE